MVEIINTSHRDVNLKQGVYEISLTTVFNSSKLTFTLVLQSQFGCHKRNYSNTKRIGIKRNRTCALH